MMLRGGGGGAKVELNPKPRKIKILGQFGTLNVNLKNIVP